MAFASKKIAFCVVLLGVMLGIGEMALTAAVKPKLDNPAKFVERAPAFFQAKFVTTRGTFVVDVTRDWAPLGADRFYNLVKNGFYTNCRFFRVIAGFMAQFGLHGDPQIAAVWEHANISDDPVKQSNLRGFVSFATSGPNTRTTQLFINYADRNAKLDGMGFAPFGKVSQGMAAVDALFSDYGEGAPEGKGPDQETILKQGNVYLDREYPLLDWIKSAVILPPKQR